MKHSLFECAPATTPEFIYPAWLGAVSWALRTPSIVGEYRENTGDQWMPSKSPIERMIDEATDREWVFVESFTGWFNQNIWGDL